MWQPDLNLNSEYEVKAMLCEAFWSESLKTSRLGKMSDYKWTMRKGHDINGTPGFGLRVQVSGESLYKTRSTIWRSLKSVSSWLFWPGCTWLVSVKRNEEYLNTWHTLQKGLGLKNEDNNYNFKEKHEADLTPVTSKTMPIVINSQNHSWWVFILS